VASHNHPDHLTVQLTGTSVGVDQIRAVSRMFEKTAQLADNQTVIIEDADKMTEAASNALLKTLEEPSNNSFIILLVKDVQRLLPTIISRCYHLPLTPPVGDKLLAELGVNNSDKFVNLSHLTELTDRTVQQAFQLLSATYINYLMTQQNRMAMLELLLHSEHSLRWLERITVDLSRCYHLQSFQQISYLTEQCEQQALQGFINQHSNSLAAIFNVINECSKQLLLLTQINKEFCLEKLLVDIADIINSHVAQPRGI
jgi:DNA polymerase-3 subunit delta'